MKISVHVTELHACLEFKEKLVSGGNSYMVNTALYGTCIYGVCVIAKRGPGQLVTRALVCYDCASEPYNGKMRFINSMLVPL